jgi:phospholipase/carboxylesterase
LVPLAGAFDVPASVRFVFPEAPLSLRAQGYGDGRAWFPLDLEELQRAALTGTRADRSQTIPPGLAEAREQLADSLSAIQEELQVPSNKLILGGFSQGAMVSCDAAATSELELAGLLVLSGTLLAEKIWAPGFAKRKGMPVVQSHGMSDPLLPYDAALTLRALWERAGAQVTFVPFAGGHTIPPAALVAASNLVETVALA